MTLAAFWERVAMAPLSTYIGETWWFPLLESIHVIAATFLVGTILVVDVRLLALAARAYPASIVSRETVPWTWGAFAVAVVTGIGMFLSRADHYVANRAFQIKLILILLAGINVLVFHRIGWRDIESWDKGKRTTTIAKVAGALSICIWLGVLLAGRWVGHLL
jgi:uncharacterized membrane protein